MNHQKTSQLLEKIQALHKSMANGGDHPDPIERDLMLSYLRKLYELYLLDQSDAPSQNAPAAARKPEPRIVDLGDNEPPKPKVESQAEPQPQQPVQSPPPPPTPPAVEQKQVPEQAEPKAEEPPKPDQKQDEAYAPLFEHHKAVELGDKLSSAPVSDLKRAFAINDRLLYINELFGRNAGAFEQALQLLNRYESLPEAKGYICELAEEFDWLEEQERLDTARTFIRTVRRRYIDS